MPPRRVLALAALASTAAAALDAPQWPPPESQQVRMRELQQVLADPRSTPAQRDAARAALADLLRSPAGQGHGLEAKPPRAAIEPPPPVATPRVPEPAKPDGAASLRAVETPRPKAPAVDPRTGAMLAPTGNGAVDPLTGRVLHEVPGGYVDPATGRFIPR